MEANKIQHVEEQMWYPQAVMFATQIGAASTQGQSVINGGYQKEYRCVKQSFVSVECPKDGKVVYTWTHPDHLDHHKWHMPCYNIATL
eukprot:10442961-Ditylum_brightwellii.AAC.1